MEIINSIVEFWENDYQGFRITTDKQVIEFKVTDEDNETGNYNEPGFLTTNDDIKKFIGKSLLSIERVAEDFTKTPFTKDSLDEGGAVFININCGYSWGDKYYDTLQLVVYNSQNGYYGNTVIFTSKDLNFEETL